MSGGEILTVQAIAHIHSPFAGKFGVPRQSGLADEVKATVVFCPEYRNREAVRGLENFSHIWLIWRFHQAVRDTWSPTVRPPRLGGNQRVGVFASRSPFRPNAIGLSAVRLETVEDHPDLGPVLHVAGADLVDGTPILDIKPYVPYADAYPGATGGFVDQVPRQVLEVDIPEVWMQQIPAEHRQALIQVLAQDPRPSYQRDPERVYGMTYGGWNVRFTVNGSNLTVCGVEPVVQE